MPLPHGAGLSSRGGRQPKIWAYLFSILATTSVATPSPAMLPPITQRALRVTGRHLRFPYTAAGRRARLGGYTSMSNKAYDAEQTRMFDEEQIIQVTFNDAPVKPISKREGHLTRLGPILHRAFSVFHFDSEGRLLLQRRAASKITFPLYWTNTCCSHPLWTPAEMGDDKNVRIIEDAVLGCKRAAIRKLGQELGVPGSALSLDDLNYTTRIHYIADSDDEWGEHEVDYLFLSQSLSGRELPLQPNPNEVAEVKYVTQDELRHMMREADKHRGTAHDADGASVIRLTPWSRAIMERFLFVWWPSSPASNQPGRPMKDPNIHRLGRVL